MKILALSDSYPVHPRLKKVSRYFGKTETTTFFLWNRGDDEILGDRSETVFNLPSSLGNKWKKALNLIRFRKAVKVHLSEFTYDLVICRHWQQLVLLSTIRNKQKYEIVYDVCDMPNNKWVRHLESRLINKTSIVVLASRFFILDYTSKIDELVVLENRSWSHFSKKKFVPTKVETPINVTIQLTFLGRIRYGEILARLIECVQKDHEISLNFYGTGPDESKLILLVNQLEIKNVYFHGEYIEEKIPNIYEKSDYIWAAYDNQLLNVKKAISNKFFETLTYQTPGIFSEDTELGELITTQEIGFIVNPYSTESIIECFEKMKDKSMSRKIKNNQKKWNEPLYFDDYLVESPYLKIDEMKVEK